MALSILKTVPLTDEKIAMKVARGLVTDVLD